MLFSILQVTVRFRSSWSADTSDVDDMAALMRVSSAKQLMNESLMQVLISLIKITIEHYCE